MYRRHLTPTPLTAADVPAAAALLAGAYPHRADEPARWGAKPNGAQRWAVAWAEGTMSLLASRDFRETMRMHGLELDDVRAVLLEPVDWYEGKLAGRGIRVTTLADQLTDDATVWRSCTRRIRRHTWLGGEAREATRVIEFVRHDS